MKLISICALALNITACGAASNLQSQADAASQAQQQNDAGTSSQQPAKPASSPSVKVTSTTTVEIDGQAPSDQDPAAKAAKKADSTLLLFAGGAYGWFFADGSFDRGASYIHGQKAAAYCRFEAPDCEGRCIIDSLPAKDSLFTNGPAYFRAIETETDLGQTVVSSIWQGGACKAQVKTLQHAYSPANAWTLDAGDSTIPSKHEQAN